MCRKIKYCRIPYSPEASIWIRRVQVYYLIIRWHKGQIRNKGNLKRVARRCNIQNPMGLSMAKYCRGLRSENKSVSSTRKIGSNSKPNISMNGCIWPKSMTMRKRSRK
jgi:hypothetical protein